MPPPPWTPNQRRRLRWRHLIERKALVRHPVSLTRQRAGSLLLAAIIIGLVLYSLNTRDETIRRRAVAFLTEATAGEVEVGAARFRMFGGITLDDVRVAVPYDADLDPSAVDPVSREIFSARSLKLVHNPWRLLFGSLQVDRIVATRPRITLVHNLGNGLRNWYLLSGEKTAQETRRLKHRPQITLRSAEAVFVSISPDGMRDKRKEELDADVRPHAQLDQAYCIEVRRFSKPAERTMVVFDPGAKLVTNTPFVDAQVVRLQLPKTARRLFDKIDLQGEVKLARLLYDTRALEERDTAIELRRVRCSIPLSLWRSEAATPQAAGAASDAIRGGDSTVAVTEVRGRLTLRGKKLEIDVEGRINEADCSLVGHLDLAGAGLDEMGIDVRIIGKGVIAPEGVIRDELLTDPKVPRNLRKFFEDYDPHGKFNIDFHLTRRAEASARPALSGALQAQGVEATCRWFPWPVQDVRGRVRFEGDQVYLEDLTCRHGSGAVNVNGRIDRSTRHFAAEVNITASAVPLDVELYRALSPQYRSIWKRFNPQGLARVNVRLRREGCGADEPEPKWQRHVTADLVDAQVTFTEYPYQLDGVHGRVELEPDHIRFIGLTGRHDDASVRIDGYALMAAPGASRVELRVEARDMRLDESFAAALPPEGRGAFDQFRPQGFVDLLGTVSLRDPQQGLIYDLRADVHNATLCYEQFPYPIEDVRGTVSVRPEGFSIVNITGRHAAAAISARGDVRRRADGFLAELAFDCRNVALDQELYEALPGPLKKAWDLFQPKGSIRVRTGLHLVSEAGKRRLRHRTELEATDADIRFTGLPLPLSSVSGRALITDQRVEILSMHGRAGSGEIELKGDLDLTGPGLHGTFILDAQGMTFNKVLLAALPPRLREVMEAIAPTGGFGLRLDPLRLDIDRDGKTHWSVEGELRLKDAGGKLGIRTCELSGSVTGRAGSNTSGDVSFTATAALDRASLAGWRFENLQAQLDLPAGSNTIQVGDASGDIYGGLASGTAEIILGPNRTEYQASITARDLQLDEYIRAHRPAAAGDDEKRTSARGLIYGNTILRGRTGKNGYWEGAGELFVREAHVWKLPLVFAIFQVLNLAPDENVFHDGWVKFYLSPDTLTLQEIDLQGRAVSFVGGGRMDLRTRQLDVTLLAGSPVRIRVPFLTDILEGASRELMEVRVRGTVQRPKIQPQPLKSLAKALATLFPETPPRPTDRPIARPRE